MDPFTALGAPSAVLSLAKEAWKLGNYLVQLYEDTKIVDETVINLAAEVNALGTACDTVHHELEPIVATPNLRSGFSYDTYGHLWSCIDNEAERCRRTLRDLGLVIDEVREESTNLFHQGRRQIKLNKSKDKVSNIRQRIRTHMDGLHTILLTVNIKVAHLAPGHATQDLGRKVDELRETVQRLQQGINSSAAKEPDLAASAALVQCAKDVVMSGSTLFASSVVGSSVLGGYDAAGKNIAVASWLGNIESLRQDTQTCDPSDRCSSAPSVFSESQRNTWDTGGSVVTVDAELNSKPYDLFNADSDDEFNMDIAQAAVEAGRLAFAQSEWADADSYFQESLTLLRQLPARHRSVSDIFELQCKLAVCAYHTQEPAVAESALISVTQLPANSDEHRQLVCDAGHMLSQVYIQTGRLELARIACESAWKGRTRLLGKQHESCLASLAMMSRIYRLLNNSARANIISSMIPESRRSALIAATESLAPLSPASKASQHEVEPRVFHAESPYIAQDEKSDQNQGPVTKDAPNKPDYTAGSLLTVKSAPELILQVPGGIPVPLNRSETAPLTKMHTLSAAITEISDEGSYNPTACSTIAGNTAVEDTLRNGSTTLSARSLSALPLLASRYSLEDEIQAHIPVPCAGQSLTQGPDAAVRQRWLARLQLRPVTALEHLICVNRLDDAMSSILAETALRQVRMETGPRSVRRLKPNRVDPSTDCGSPMALHFAALFGDVVLGRALLENGFSSVGQAGIGPLLGRKQRMATPIEFAIGARRTPMIRILLQHLALVRGAPGGSIYPGQNIVEKGWIAHCLDHQWLQATECTDAQELVSTMECLSSFGWSIADDSESWQLLNCAVLIPNDRAFLRKTVVSYLLAEGVQVLPLGSRPTISDWGYTPTALYTAALNDAADVIPTLLERQSGEQLSALVNIVIHEERNRVEKTALYVAVQRALEDHRRPLDTVRALLAAGADVHAITYQHFYRTHMFKATSLEQTTRTTPLELARTYRPLRRDLLTLLQGYDRGGAPDINRPSKRWFKNGDINVR